MKSIWSAPASEFQSALSQYTTSLPKKPSILSLESFITSLRLSVPRRCPPHITSAEYQKLISWKLTRGKWRPRLQKFADGLTDSSIIPASSEAYAHYRNGETKQALRRLTQLKGCGPASASLVLSLDGACFMGDDVLEAALSERKYTPVAFVELQDVVRRKCSELGGDWDAWKIERAVYAAVRLNKFSGDGKEARMQVAKVGELKHTTKLGKRKSEKDCADGSLTAAVDVERGGSRSVDWKEEEEEDRTKGLRRSKRVRRKRAEDNW